jgi:hypothetical protein
MDAAIFVLVLGAISVVALLSIVGRSGKKCRRCTCGRRNDDGGVSVMPIAGGDGGIALQGDGDRGCGECTCDGGSGWSSDSGSDGGSDGGGGDGGGGGGGD